MPGRGRQSIAGGHVRRIGAGTRYTRAAGRRAETIALEGTQFRAVDGPSARASIAAASAAAVRHVVYVGVAHPAPIMRDYIAVRRDCEAAIATARLLATILRPWYILGPKHWWPLALLPVYRVLERVPATREAAMRLGLVSIREMLAALLWSIKTSSG